MEAIRSPENTEPKQKKIQNGDFHAFKKRLKINHVLSIFSLFKTGCFFGLESSFRADLGLFKQKGQGGSGVLLKGVTPPQYIGLVVVVFF